MTATPDDFRFTDEQWNDVTKSASWFGIPDNDETRYLLETFITGYRMMTADGT